MLRALSTAATGMGAQQTQIEVIANNLANVNTAGFKRSRAEFQDLLYQNLRTPGATLATGQQVPASLQVGLGTRMAATTRIHGEGDLRQTGVPLDVAIEGEGFLAVTMPSGEIAYTRAGSLRMDTGGRLVTQEGYPLVSGVTIPPDSGTINITTDGVVSVTQPGQQTQTMNEVGRLTLTNFPNPSGLISLGRNLYKPSTISGNPIEAQPGTLGMGTLAQGSLEMSNVKVVDEMVDMIVAQRAYEIDSRVIKAADDMLGQTAQLR